MPSLRAALVLSLAALAQAQSVLDLDSCCNNEQDATTWSLVYGIPLIAFANQTTKVFANVGGPNAIDTQASLASVSGAAVVKPNVDTVYSRVIIDLSQNDLVLTVPSITDRFYIFPFYDVFGNNFASLSPVTNSTPGKYLLRRSDDALAAPGLQLLNASTPSAVYGSNYTGIINFPTTYGTMLIRILVIQNTTADLNIVHNYQAGYSISSTPRLITQPSTPTVPTITAVLNNATTNVSSASDVLTFLAAIASYNQPEVLSARFRAASILGYAGLNSGGYYTKPNGVNLTQAYADAMLTYTNVSGLAQNLYMPGNGWQLSIPSYEGNFTTNYNPRALVAQTGYQQLTPNVVIYPGWMTSSFGSYTLGANESFLFTFSGRPPVAGYSSLYPSGVSAGQAGFWSLTVYGPDQYLINNTLNRYEVGDRTPSLVYNDGTLVYTNSTTNGTAASVVKPFKILMQSASVAPPSNWTSNWLPSAPGGGTFSFILRFYRPSDAFTNGSYVFPTVQRVSLVT